MLSVRQGLYFIYEKLEENTDCFIFVCLIYSFEGITTTYVKTLNILDNFLGVATV